MLRYAIRWLTTGEPTDTVTKRCATTFERVAWVFVINSAPSESRTRTLPIDRAPAC